MDILAKLGIQGHEIRTPDELNQVDGLIIPGGESTVMAKFIDTYDLRNAILGRAKDPMFPIYGTCAGLILLAKNVPNLQAETLGILDISVERNAYGRQLSSFITKLNVTGIGEITGGHFIRAPKITRTGKDIEILSSYEDSPVFVRQNNIWGSTFHPELAGDIALHKLIFAR